ncbi:hypothetical protein RvY_12968 [Ramazzottius varieornatus]|uniref:DUF4378 domain-containing protein n=1 Tax=Ramazzottius varieornatus TaxID=947166 RepID=A0A1D1VLA7_RAMVA|nr:hypothetical protein RvY_12968 [Ramazzottius varieornatus]
MPPPVAKRVDRLQLNKRPPSSAISVETLSTKEQIAGIADRERVLLDELRKLQEKKTWLAEVMTQVGTADEGSSMDEHSPGRRHSRPRSDGFHAPENVERVLSSTSQPSEIKKRAEDSKERLRVLGDLSRRLNAQLQEKLSEFTVDQRSSEFNKSDPYNFLSTYTKKLGYLKVRASLSKSFDVAESKAKKDIIPTRTYTDLQKENVIPLVADDRLTAEGAVRRNDVPDVTKQTDKAADREGAPYHGETPENAMAQTASGEEPVVKPNRPTKNDSESQTNNYKTPVEEFSSTPASAEKSPMVADRNMPSGSENMFFTAERTSLARRVGSNELLNSGKILSPKLISLASVQQKYSPKANNVRLEFRPVEMVPLVPPQDVVPFIDLGSASYRSPPVAAPPPVVPPPEFRETGEWDEGGTADNGGVREVTADFDSIQPTRNAEISDPNRPSRPWQSGQVFSYDDDFLPESPAHFHRPSPVISPASDISSGINFVVRQPDNIEDGGRNMDEDKFEESSVALALSDGEVTPRVEAAQTSPKRWQDSSQEEHSSILSPISSVPSLLRSPSLVAEAFASDNEFRTRNGQSIRDENEEAGQFSSESEISFVKSDFLSRSSTTSSNRTVRDWERPSSQLIAEDFEDSLKDQKASSEVADHFHDLRLDNSRRRDVGREVRMDENVNQTENGFDNEQVADRNVQDEELDPRENHSTKETDVPEVLAGDDEENLSTLETVSSLSLLSSSGHDGANGERQPEEGEVGNGDFSPRTGAAVALIGDNLDAYERANQDARKKEESDFVPDKQEEDNKRSEEEHNDERTEDDVESVDSASLLVSFANNEVPRNPEAKTEEPVEKHLTADNETTEHPASILEKEIREGLDSASGDAGEEKRHSEDNERSPKSARSISPLSSVSEDLKLSSGDDNAKIVPTSRRERPPKGTSSSPRRPSPRREEQIAATDLLVSPRGMDATMPAQDWMEDDFFSGILPPGTPDTFKDVISPRKSVRARSPPIGDFVRRTRIEKSISHIRNAARFVHSAVGQNIFKSFFDIYFPSSEFSSGVNQESQMAFDFIIDFCDQMYALPDVAPVPPKQRFPGNLEQFLTVMENQFERNAARLIIPEPGVKLDRNERDELDQQAVYNISFKDLERHENEWCNFAAAEASLKAETANEIWDDLVDEMVVEFQENKHFDEWLRS